MKAILLNLTHNDKAPAIAVANSKQVDGTRSFAISLKESCQSDLDKDQSFSLLSPNTKARIVSEGTQVKVASDGPIVAGIDTKGDCCDQSAGHDLEGEIPSDSKAPGEERPAATPAKSYIYQARIRETTKAPLNRRDGKVRDESKETQAVSTKKNEKVSKRAASAAEIPTAGNTGSTVVCRGEAAMRCYIQENSSNEKINSAVPSDESDGKLPAITVGTKKSVSLNGTLNKATRQETQGSVDGLSHLTKNAITSTSSNSQAGHPPDKTSQVKNDDGTVAKTGRSSEQFASATSVIQSKGDTPGVVVTRLAEGMTAMTHMQLSDQGGKLAKENSVVDQSAGARDSTFVDMHQIGHRNDPGGVGEAGPMLLGATSKAIEVGVASGTHGWLKIRAEIEHGVVAASIATKSPVAQEVLHHELPSLNAFLQEEKVGGGVVAIKQMPSTNAGDMGHGGDADGREQPMHPQSGKGNDTIAPSGGEKELGGDEQTGISESLQGSAGYLSPLPAMTVGMGGWLNIRV